MPVEILVGGRQAKLPLRPSGVEAYVYPSTEAVLRQINWGFVPFY